MIQKNSDIYKIISSMPDPIAAERDYIECHILSQMFADASLGNELVFTGGATLCKSYNICPRISHDLDLASTEFNELPQNRTGCQMRRFKRHFKEFVFDVLRPRINYAINQDKRFMLVTDKEWCALHNPEQTISYPTLHVLYPSVITPNPGKTCIEIIPRKYNPNSISHRTVTPYSIRQPMATIPTAAYQQTFWDKIFALHSFATIGIPAKALFITRHYYDVARLAPLVNLAETYHMFNDTVSYQARYTSKNIAPIKSPADIHILPDVANNARLGTEYADMNDQFIQMPQQWSEIGDALRALQTRIHNMGTSR